jgi:hypothetical protein
MMSIPTGFVPHFGKPAQKAAPKFAGKGPLPAAKKHEEPKKHAPVAHQHAPAAKKPDPKHKLNYHA